MSDNAQKVILVFAANPKNTRRLRLDEEVRAIDEGLKRGKLREAFKLTQKWAVSDADLRRGLLDEQPEIVHFSGHGAGEDGLVFEDENGRAHLIGVRALADLFRLTAAHVRCVVLNACYTEAQAEAISQHIPYVIGMSTSIGDKAAIKFTTGFYDALAAGKSYEEAFEFGKNAIDLRGIPEHLTPVCKKKAI